MWTGLSPQTPPWLMTMTTVRIIFCGSHMTNSLFNFSFTLHLIIFTTLTTDRFEEHDPWGCSWYSLGLILFQLLIAPSLDHLHDSHHGSLWGLRLVRLFVVFSWFNPLSAPPNLSTSSTLTASPWSIVKITARKVIYGLYLSFQWTFLCSFFFYFNLFHLYKHYHKHYIYMNTPESSINP